MEFFKQSVGAGKDKPKNTDSEEEKFNDFIDNLAEAATTGDEVAKKMGRILIDAADEFVKKQEEDSGEYFFSTIMLFCAVLSLKSNIRKSVISFASKRPPEPGKPHPTEVFKVLEEGFDKGGLKGGMEALADYLNRYGNDDE